MRKLFSTLFLFSLLVSACTTATSTSTSGEPVTESAEISGVQELTEIPETQTSESQQSEVDESEAQVYHLVPGESSVTYEVGETFFNQDNRFNLAVGVTTEIQGEIQVDPQTPANSRMGTITVDISQFKSDSGRRDNAIRERFLESARYPLATFEPIQIHDLPFSYIPGEELRFKVSGTLTVRETTKMVTFEVTARLDEGILQGSAETTILMSDFGIGPIEIAGILGTEDEVKITLTFVARP